MNVRVDLETLKIIKENEGSPDEPYLWVVYLKVDNDTVSIGNLAAASVTVHAPKGSHGNLGPASDDVDEGHVINIPDKVGRWDTTLTTIKGMPLDLAEATSVVAVAVVALEEDATKSSAAEKGRKALVKTLQRELDRALQLAMAPDVQALQAKAQHVVVKAIEEASVSALSFTAVGSLLDIGGIVDPDDFVGGGVVGPLSFRQIREAGDEGIRRNLVLSSGGGKYRVRSRVRRTSLPMHDLLADPTLGAATVRTLGAVAWHAERSRRKRIDVFARGEDRRIYQCVQQGRTWSGWGANVGAGTLVSGPAVTSWGRGRLDVFALGDDRRVWHTHWDGAAWSGWGPIGTGTFTSSPAAVSADPNHLDVFARGEDNRMYHLWWRGGGWSWGAVGDGTFLSAPAAVSRGPNRLDVFAIGGDRRMYVASWNGGWSGWAPIGQGTFTSAPAAAAWGGDRLDAFARGGDDRIYHASWNGGWSGWAPIGQGTFVSAPAAVSTAENRLDVFAIGKDRRMWRAAWDGTRWTGWSDDMGSGTFS